MAAGVVKRGLTRGAEIFVFGALPIIIGVIPLAMLVVHVGLSRPTFAWDLHPTWEAAVRLAHGDHDLYAPVAFREPDGLHHANYIYPPILAILLAPLGMLSFGAASSVFIAISVAAVVAALRLLGVTDWRCYGVVFLWGPVLGGLGVANITAFLLFGVAFVWRFRRQSNVSAMSLAFLAAIKLFLWPLLAWELRVSPRRVFLTLGYAGAMVFGSWAVIGFAGLEGYWGLLQRIEPYWQSTGYGFSPILQDVGVPATATSLLLSLVALAGTSTAVALAAKGLLDERQSLISFLGIALLFSPVSWLHYAMLLIVPIALTTPRLSWQWLLPLALWATPAEEANGSVWRIAFFALVVGATTVSALLHASPKHHDPVVVEDAMPPSGSLERIAEFGLLRT
jgi:hypothetical protein